MFRQLFNFFVFSSIFISCCAVMMTHQTIQLFKLDVPGNSLLLFVFFSTLCSYNFHWYFTPFSANERIRSAWTIQHRKLQLILAIIGGMASVYLTFQLTQYWLWLLPAVILTFLYTAPKLPVTLLGNLKKIAIGKTIYLSFVWMYVTTALPLLIAGNADIQKSLLFCGSRFFLIYAICIIFDYRDREQDKKDGIRSMITYFNEKGINRLFYFSLLLFVLTTISLYWYGIPALIILILLSPGIITALLYNYSKKHYSDYLYYFVLDGLMMFSALFTLFLPF